MALNNLRLSRAQIAKIVGNDPEAIKQFEKLFTLNQDYLVSGAVDDTTIDSGNALAAAGAALDRATDLESRITSLELAPAYTPHVRRYDYGSFYSLANQTAAVANTAYGVTFSNTREAFGIGIGSPTSRLTIARGNIYRVSYTLQMINAHGSNHRIWSWLRKNGTTDVTASSSVMVVDNGSKENMMTGEFLLQLDQNDYIELMWEVSHTGVTLHYDAATGVHPAVPSANIVITNNISAQGA
jgi:hypothetical protein